MTRLREAAGIAVLLAVVVAAGLALGGAASSRPRDKKPPSVSVTSPSAGATVTGSGTVSASASDNVGVTRVTWFVDGMQVASDTTAPWSQSWDSTTVSDGGHSVAATAHDAAGNTR